MKLGADLIMQDLDRMQAALRSGRIAELPECAAALDASLGAVRQAGGGAIHPDDLERLRARALRTAATLGAAALGIRAARRRLAEIRAIADGFSSYDPTGRRDAAVTPGTHLAQRL